MCDLLNVPSSHAATDEDLQPSPGKAAWPPSHPKPAGLALPPDDRAHRAAQQRTRRKLWTLAHKLHCPIIGTCLDAAELRRIARNHGNASAGTLDDYALHVSFVSAADARNSLSLATHKALEKKFAGDVKRFAKARSRDALEALWQGALSSGEVAGALWATLTHPRCDDALTTQAFEQVHMLSHQVGAGQRADLQKLRTVEAELGSIRHAFDDLQRRTRVRLGAREAETRDLQQRLTTLDAERRRLLSQREEQDRELARLRAACGFERAANLERQLAAAHRCNDRLRRRCDELQAAVTAAERSRVSIERECGERGAETAGLEHLITQATTACDGCRNTPCGECPNLHGRRILCVGGRSRLIEQYRDLVARCNGLFEHHDGGLEDNRQRLDAMLSSADAVVCATDSVSHDAYYRLKRFCKRHAKPHVFLRSSGIATFARALDSVTTAETP